MKYRYYALKARQRIPREISKTDIRNPEYREVYRVPASIPAKAVRRMVEKGHPDIDVLVGKPRSTAKKSQSSRKKKVPRDYSKVLPKVPQVPWKPQVYHGTTPRRTHVITKQFSPTGDGITLNLYKGFSKIKRSLRILEELNHLIFIDNGSFERFSDFKKGKIPGDVYFSLKESKKYFDYITGQYEELFEYSKKPQNLIITIPEVIASSELTQKLQEQYKPKYISLKKKYGFRMLVSMQFNPHDMDWDDQMEASAKYIDKSFPSTIRIGVPFGNDFRKIQNEDDFEKIEDLFEDQAVLDEFDAHLFASGTPLKFQRFGNKFFIGSIDASSILNWSKNGHYLSITGRIIDSRNMRGKQGSPEIIKRDRDLMKSEGINWEDWLNKEKYSTNDRFKVNLEHYDEIIQKIKEGKLKL